MKRSKGEIMLLIAICAIIFGALLNPFTKTLEQTITGGIILANFFVVFLIKGEK